MPSLREFLDAPASELKLPVNHLSATSVSMFMRCPEQFRQRYVLGIKEAPGAALVLGSGFHFANETNFRQKIESGQDLPVETIVEAFHAGWDQKLDEYGGVDEIKWDEREKPDTLRDKGATLSRKYREQVSPKLFPRHVEREFNMPLAGTTFNGYIDLEGNYAEGVSLASTPENPSPDVVVDYKTAKAIKRELKPEWLLQARLYQLETGKRVEYHVASKSKDLLIATPVDSPQLAIDPSETALNTTTRLIERVVKQLAWHFSEFGPDVAWPGAITHPWACGFCGYRPNCIWWAS